jgi:hypothetical protein
MGCLIPKCSRESEIIYYGKEVCWHHWSLHCESKAFDLKKRLNIEERKEQQRLWV